MSKVAIIGSGMGGLVAGNLLAKKGHEVTIFESHITPGGYTSGFWRKGFSTQIKTSIKNLYIGSCWSGQLGGVPGAVFAAKGCAKKIK